MTRYVVLEGGDGCGKSSQARALCDWLEGEGLSVLHVREPGSTPVGEVLREILLSSKSGPMRPLTEALLFSAARAQLVTDVIAPALAVGRVVVAERCYLSTVVYQGYARAGDAGQDGGSRGEALDVDWLFDLAHRVHGAHLPDRIFVLDVAPAIAAQRRLARTADRFESRDEAYHERVRVGFRKAAESDPRIRLIDASGPFHQVQDSLRAAVTEVLR